MTYCILKKVANGTGNIYKIIPFQNKFEYKKNLIKINWILYIRLNISDCLLLLGQEIPWRLEYTCILNNFNIMIDLEIFYSLICEYYYFYLSLQLLLFVVVGL